MALREIARGPVKYYTVPGKRLMVIDIKGGGLLILGQWAKDYIDKTLVIYVDEPEEEENEYEIVKPLAEIKALSK